MLILGIDPGTELSGVVAYDAVAQRVRASKPAVKNIDLTRAFQMAAMDRGAQLQTVLGGIMLRPDETAVVFELMEGRGQRVGADTYTTVWWSGRMFEAAWTARYQAHLLGRMEIKRTLCGTTASNDAAVRHAILDKFGGEARAKGTRHQPGPVYGVGSHAWAALAVALTFAEKRRAA